MEFSKFEKIIITALIAVIVIFTILRQVRSPVIEQKSIASVVAEDNEAAEGEETVEDADIYVHVAGAVVSPGFIKIKNGSRVIDAVEIAGGLTEEADMDRINLAMKLEDEDRVYIPRISEREETSSEGMSKMININTATLEELVQIPGVGEKTAEKIIDYREKKSFKRVEDIMDVPGIGEGKFSQMKDYITVK